MVDAAYLLFLEPPQEEVDRSHTLSQRLLDCAIQTFQPHPTMMHVEILLPPSQSEEHLLHFATYIGAKSGWQLGHNENVGYYLRGENAGRWRAVPVFASDAVVRIRQECELERGVPYSLARYVSSIYPFRALASALSEERRAPAHCATLTARVLKNALGYGAPVPQSVNWYGPASLYSAVSAHAAAVSAAWPIQTPEAETAKHVEQLLRSPETPETVAAVGDAGCADAVRSLTMRVCSELQGGDSVSNAVAQRQLAMALLRWTVLRAPQADV